MARVRAIEIRNFRGIKSLTWRPTAGINCLIGPGDSGKSSVIDSIDLCLGARRNVQFTDADFHLLDVETPITIEITLGELDDGLKNLDAYGMYLRGFDAETGTIEDEPERDLETVLTVKLTVASDLEPQWTLVSARAEGQGLSRNLGWADRTRLAPTRIGALADYHLGWRRGSVLNRVSDERADASAALVKAARDARAAFGDEAQEQLGETLGIVATTAKELGIPIGENIKAMLDAHSVSFSGGTISLHNENGVPLRGLGTGSMRLLIAGLQREAAAQSSIILIDELEYGLEPHRIIRLLGSLGAKEAPPPLQVFMTTHSPVALRELSGDQLFVARGTMERHEARVVGTADGMQSTIRLYPDAFLASSVVVCEGASEVGLIRGLDQYRTTNGHDAITAQGVALVDCGGGGADRPFTRADAFQALGYRVAVVRALILLGVYALLPMIVVLSRYSLSMMVVGAMAIFTIKFWSVLWYLAMWVDQNLIQSMYPDVNVFLQIFANPGEHDAKRMLLNMITTSLYLGLPLLWSGMMAWAGVNVGRAINNATAPLARPADDAGRQGGAIGKAAVSKGLRR